VRALALRKSASPAGCPNRSSCSGFRGPGLTAWAGCSPPSNFARRLGGPRGGGPRAQPVSRRRERIQPRWSCATAAAGSPSSMPRLRGCGCAWCSLTASCTLTRHAVTTAPTLRCRARYAPRKPTNCARSASARAGFPTPTGRARPNPPKQLRSVVTRSGNWCAEHNAARLTVDSCQRLPLSIARRSLRSPGGPATRRAGGCRWSPRRTWAGSPLRVSKTRKWLAQSAVLWPGPAFVSSSKDDLMQMVASRRGGPIALLDLRPISAPFYPQDFDAYRFDPTALITSLDEAKATAQSLLSTFSGCVVGHHFS
jgi:hypothetical protein